MNCKPYRLLLQVDNDINSKIYWKLYDYNKFRVTNHTIKVSQSFRLIVNL